MKISRCYSLILGALLIASCGKVHPTSQVKGHFEPGDEEIQKDFLKKQRMIPEIMGIGVKSVIVGLPLIEDYLRMDLIAQILGTETSEVIIMVKNSFTGTLDKTDAPGGSRFRLSLKSGGAKIDLGVFPSNKTIRLIRNFKDPAGGRDVQTVWARDWAPLSAASIDDNTLRFVDFNYYHDRMFDDTTSRSLAQFYDSNSEVPRAPIPLYFEGGNFAMDGNGRCFVSESMVRSNSFKKIPRDEIDNSEIILKQFEDYVGCNRAEILERMPYEGTGHLDMWMKFLTSNTVIVGQISNSVSGLDIYETADNRAALAEVTAFLNEQAQYLTALGYDVRRIPMPAPIFRVVREKQQDGSFRNFFEGNFRSYTNSLLLNNSLIMPAYYMPVSGSAKWRPIGYKYPDWRYLADWENEAQAVYESVGLTVSKINSDALINAGGAVHCSTMQIPNLPLTL